MDCVLLHFLGVFQFGVLNMSQDDLEFQNGDFSLHYAAISEPFGCPQVLAESINDLFWRFLFHNEHEIKIALFDGEID
jgi:hypothetical protein